MPKAAVFFPAMCVLLFRTRALRPGGAGPFLTALRDQIAGYFFQPVLFEDGTRAARPLLIRAVDRYEYAARSQPALVAPRFEFGNAERHQSSGQATMVGPRAYASQQTHDATRGDKRSCLGNRKRANAGQPAQHVSRGSVGWR